MIGVKFSYMDSAVWEALNWEAVCEVLPSAPEQKPDSYYEMSHLPTQWLSYEAAALLADLGVKMEIQPPNGTMITKIRDKWSADEETVKLLEQGAAITIAIPGFGLLAVSQVTHLDDACTDELQEMLDKGWKILAVCPPNSQRRPDYILGK